MKVLYFLKKGEHVVTCYCGTVLKFSNEEVTSEEKCESDYWGVDRWTEKSIICKSCNRKIKLRGL